MSRQPCGMNSQLVEEFIALDPSRMSTLRLIREMDLPEGAVAGDFVRCAVFDQLHSHKEWSQLAKVEVVFFDRARTDEAVDLSIQSELIARSSRKPWVVRNLARECPSATCLSEAMDGFVATANAVAVRILPNDQLKLIAPFGVEDLLNGVIRPTRSELVDTLKRRLLLEKWLSRYPKLRVLN